MLDLTKAGCVPKTQKRVIQPLIFTSCAKGRAWVKAWCSLKVEQCVKPNKHSCKIPSCCFQMCLSPPVWVIDQERGVWIVITV